jgi:hypothetical protein
VRYTPSQTTPKQVKAVCNLILDLLAGRKPPTPEEGENLTREQTSLLHENASALTRLLSVHYQRTGSE